MVNAGGGRGAGPGEVPAAGLQTRATAALTAVWLQADVAQGEWPLGARADGAAGEAALGGAAAPSSRPSLFLLIIYKRNFRLRPQLFYDNW